MPLYSFWCLVHGDYEAIRTMDNPNAPCPRCGKQGIMAVTFPARIPLSVDYKQALPYGNGSKGRFVSSEQTGGLNICVPSWGSMDKAEVDYVTEAAVEKEKERVRKRQHRASMMKEKIGKYLGLAYQTKEGERAKTIKAAIKDGY